MAVVDSNPTNAASASHPTAALRLAGTATAVRSTRPVCVRTICQRRSDAQTWISDGDATTVPRLVTSNGIMM